MEKVELTKEAPVVSKGSAGLDTQVGNQPTTVSGAAAASGGVNGGNFIEPDVDGELASFSSDDTPLMNLMLKAKTVNVTSAEVDHYSIDEPSAMVTVESVTGTNKIKLVTADKMKVHAYDVLSVVGVNGYSFTGGSNVMTARPLQLFVTQVLDDDEFSVRATNGVKTAETDEYGDLPTNSSPAASNKNYIQPGTKLIILSNALYETQKEVDPDMVLPQPERQYLQKRGMNQIVSDYFESQRKRIPFSKAIIAESAIRSFKTKGNRALWISQLAKFRVKSKAGDMQYVYNTNGIRWQFRREVEHNGKWTYEDFIALAKLFYTGEDVPKSCLALCGKNFMESIQCIDWSKHPEVTISIKTNERLGWKVTSIDTVFGEFQFKREPTLDRLGYENCAALIGEDRLVHYRRKAESSFNEKVEGEEATRTGTLVWDALCLKGSCHIWVDGKGTETAPNATEFILYNQATAPATPVDGSVYCFIQDVTLSKVGSMSGPIKARAGEAYKYTTAEGWTEYKGAISAA